MLDSGFIHKTLFWKIFPESMRPQLKFLSLKLHKTFHVLVIYFGTNNRKIIYFVPLRRLDSDSKDSTSTLTLTFGKICNLFSKFKYDQKKKKYCMSCSNALLDRSLLECDAVQFGNVSQPFQLHEPLTPSHWL